MAGEWIIQLSHNGGTSSPLTCYPRDGDLLATAAIPPLSKRLYLNDIILVSGQGKLHRGGVGFHDVGVAVLILLVEHLVTNGRSQLKSRATQFSDKTRLVAYFVTSDLRLILQGFHLLPVQNNLGV